MTESNGQPQQHELDEAVRQHILERVKVINTELLTRLGTVADDLGAGGHRAALGGIDGIEREIATMRSLLLLLS